MQPPIVAPHRCSIESEGDCYRVTLVGELNEVAAVAITKAVRLQVQRLKRPKVLIDMEGLERSDLLGRAKLIELQEIIAARQGRTAWISSRARFRGMALVVCHAASDTGAKVVSSQEEAMDWLLSGK